ncbi:MAG: TolC family protein [Cyclobacteriaceae bacterium]|nr:TolC family protein [Cyclobacteriaceae bacterium]
MKLKLYLTITLIILLSAFQVQAQEVKTWSFQECVEYALDNNLTVKRGELDVQFNEVNLKQSKADMYPNFNFGSQYGINWGRSIDPTTNLFISQRIQSVGLQAGSSLTLFDGLQKLNTIKQNKLNLQGSTSDLDKAKNDVILNVVTFYTNVIFNQELLETANLQLETTTQQLQRTQKLVDAGSLAISEVLDLQSQVASNELEVVNAENNLNLALLNLKQVMQMPASENLQVVEPEIEATDYVFTGLNAQDIFQQAERSQPEVKSADLGIQSSVLGEKIAKGAYYPSLSLGYNMFTNYSDALNPLFISDGTFGEPDEIPDAGFVTGNPTQTVTLFSPNPNFVSMSNGVGDQFDDNLSRSLSFTLSVPVFNGLATKSSVQRASIFKAQAEINAREVRNLLRQIIETAYNDAIAASKAYEASQKQVQALEESFRVTEKRYNLGAVNFVDYQIVQNNLFGAKSDLVRTKYDYIFKTKILDFYQGNPLEF